MEALIAVTYRCNAKCRMCNIWKNQSSAKDEISLDDLKKLPTGLAFANITGGEPFLRADIEQIAELLLKKAKRVVISTNGYFTEKIIGLARKYPKIGIRVSLEGLPSANDDLRRLHDGFDRGLRTILMLKEMGLKDIGFGITVSNRNAKDSMELYIAAKAMDVEFATATTHNSFYFHKFDNRYTDRDAVTREFKKLVRALLKSKTPKDWFRAYFNFGLVNYVNGNERLLPCEMGTDVFFMDPFGEIYPCNAMKASMGNIRKLGFEEIWNSKKADAIRADVKACKKNCWMIGSVSPAMKKRKLRVLRWILLSKLRGRVDYSCVEPKPLPKASETRRKK